MATGKIAGDQDIFLFKNFSGSNISDWETSSSVNVVTANIDEVLNMGYTPIAVTGFWVGNRYASVYSFTLALTGASANLLRGRNYHGSTVSCSSPWIKGIFVRDEFVTVFGADDSIPAGCNTPFIRKSFSCSISVAAKTGERITATTLNYSVPTGYKLFGIAGYYSGHSSVIVCTVNPDNADAMIRMFNASSSTRTGTANVVVTFIREDFEQEISAS